MSWNHDWYIMFLIYYAHFNAHIPTVVIKNGRLIQNRQRTTTVYKRTYIQSVQNLGRNLQKSIIFFYCLLRSLLLVFLILFISTPAYLSSFIKGPLAYLLCYFDVIVICEKNLMHQWKGNKRASKWPTRQ